MSEAMHATVSHLSVAQFQPHLLDTKALLAYGDSLSTQKMGGLHIHAWRREEYFIGDKNRTLNLAQQRSTLSLLEAKPQSANEHTVSLADTAALAETAAIDPFQSGHVVGNRYQIEELIGKGGFALVYRARDLHRAGNDDPDRHVALKVLQPQLRECPLAIARLNLEFRLTHNLTHRNIVRVFALDTHDNICFIVMELLDGETLAAQLHPTTENRTSPPLALSILRDCADALTFAHERNIVHGDFKPSNVFVLRDGSAKIIDFGSSSDSNSSIPDNLTEQIDHTATPAYASPQVLSCMAATPHDDIFSFSRVAFEVLSSKRLTELHRVLDLQDDHAVEYESDAPEIETLSAQRTAALRQGMSWRREDRPASACALFLALTQTQPPASPSLSSISNLHADSCIESKVGAESSESAKITPAGASTAPTSESRQTNGCEVCEPSMVLSPAIASHGIPLSMPVTTENSTPTKQSIQQQTVAAITQWTALPTRLVSASRQLRIFGLMTLFVLSYAAFLLSDFPLIEKAPSQSARVAAPLTPRPATPSATATTLEAIRPSGNNRPSVIEPPPSTPPRSTLSFDSSSMAVTENAVAVAITLKRTKGNSGRVRVNWRLKQESAKLGRDFDGPLSGTAEFADLQTIRTLFIPLLQSADTHGDRTFTVELTSANSRRIEGTPHPAIRVTILDTPAI